MDTHRFLLGALIVLSAAVLSVPLAKRLGLGSVLGYLAAGAVIGPYGLSLIADVDAIRSFSELGVVLLMFLVGLELLPVRLWQMRKPVFGYGSAQVAAASVVFTVAGLLLGNTLPVSLISGLGLSLSSTAFALQVLAERNQLTTAHGRDAFSILLFQDLAIIPMLALVGALGVREAAASDGSVALGIAKTVGIFLILFVLGRYVIKKFFHLVAQARSQEVFTAAALLLIIGVGLLVEVAGMSMAFGAFAAGVLLADSDYRHELEADLEPFKGLLLGLFFVAVGMSVSFGLLVESPLLVVGLVLAYVLVKSLLLYGLARLWAHPRGPALTLAVSISQGGEFAFVLFGLAVGRGIMPERTADLLVLTVTLSMAMTPLLLLGSDRLLARLAKGRALLPSEALPDEASRVVIAGFGRFGQIVGRILALRGVPFTALDRDPQHIEFVRQFGSKVYFGDCSRLDLLRAAKLDRAEVFVLAIDDVETSVKTAALVRHEFPNVRIFARARNRQHAYRLLDLGVPLVSRETFGSSVEVGRDVLVSLGLPVSVADETTRIFRQSDEDLIQKAFKHHADFAKLKELSAQGRKELEGLFQQDMR
jgi:monovalent cation:proton antiporter-2 (CPA2) family protein